MNVQWSVRLTMDGELFGETPRMAFKEANAEHDAIWGIVQKLQRIVPERVFEVRLIRHVMGA